ncbi:DUF1223 domain-containing protein [Salinisphaera sp. T31B1]|uniref:DUF1223 domain-containing protein n=1 Tax=Salinisphaera sp. T31B1 TaxID=727963 RepID=UPI00333EAFBF
MNASRGWGLILWVLGVVATPAIADTRQPVVLELFTSNSCAQCPAANDFMRELQRAPPPGIELILLSEHVDYWNPYGWIDRYARARYTERQQMYGWDNFQGKVYTPQLIIDGRRSTVGSWKDAVREEIQAMAGQADRPVSIELVANGSERLSVDVGFTHAPSDNAAEIWVALIQNDVVSVIGAGENAGRTLHEDGLVHALVRAQPGAGVDGAVPQFNASVNLPPGVARKDLAVVAFAQRTDSHAVVGAARRPLP